LINNINFFDRLCTLIKSYITQSISFLNKFILRLEKSYFKEFAILVKGDQSINNRIAIKGKSMYFHILKS